MRTVLIDCAGVKTADEFWQLYLTQVQPAGAALFGRNLDAFWDAVESGGPGWPNAKLVIENTENLDSDFLEKLRLLATEATQTKIKIR